MTAMTVRVTGVEVDPLGRDLLRRWLVTAEALDGGGEITLLVHSPSLAFRDAAPAGRVFRLELAEPVSEPYAGAFTAHPVEE
ncbi:hypothetical protein Afil01_37500 [Actinorhabdospora filicis]|uniref:Uncharacterized protein n=1 Tax=Actinorhabdospora filicis TaxID=1785913 RepID=A0A9W6SMZ0_9ACTN|nr:hypothetical protein [Actinorhabdospora filicis]GLZ78943.1 hypothetical protein Afil01_37500 [Actinorhabdospora filicis]